LSKSLARLWLMPYSICRIVVNFLSTREPLFTRATAVAYALFNLQDRGKLFVHPGAPLYQGQIVGEHCRAADLVVNPAKGKKLTNMRASGSDEAVILTPPLEMTLEDCIAYINDDELVEVTPKAIRLRKMPGLRIRG